MKDHTGDSASTLDLLRLCRGIVGHNEDEGIRVLIEVEGVEGTVSALKAARLQGMGPPSRLHLLGSISDARAKRANGHANGAAPIEEPPLAESVDDYGAVPPWSGDGIKPRTKTQFMARALVNKDLWRLYKLRRINKPWPEWLSSMGLSEFTLFTAVVYGKRTTFLVSEDFIIRLDAGKFPRIQPHTETTAQTRKRRDAFNRKRKRETKMQTGQATATKVPRRTKIRADKLESMLSALPATPGLGISVQDLAAKLRNHPAWRGLKLATIEHAIRMARQYSPDIGSKPVPHPTDPTRQIWMLWRA